MASKDTYAEFAAACHAAWLAAGGDIELARAESRKQEAADWYRVERTSHGWDWNNHPGMRGGAGSPNRVDEELIESTYTPFFPEEEY